MQTDYLVRISLKTALLVDRTKLLGEKAFQRCSALNKSLDEDPNLTESNTISIKNRVKSFCAFILVKHWRKKINLLFVSFLTTT